MARRRLTWVLLLGAALHLLGLARSTLPAQDGLKFLRVARQFQSQPWADVVRGADQHPLYPALIAVAEPACSLILGRGPTAWRVAAQLVAALSSLATVPAVFLLARALFDERAGVMAALLFVLLPVPSALGRETLSDASALCLAAWALALGERALRAPSMAAAIGSGLAAGLGYWTRPEVALVPLALLARVAWPGVGWFRPIQWRPALAVALPFLVLVGGYALVKGEVSEKLALRRTAAIGSRHDRARPVGHALPAGLDDPAWDFSAKEEFDAPGRLAAPLAARRALLAWAEGLGWAFAPLAILAAWKLRAGPGRSLILIYMTLFSAVLLRHAMMLGYLSGRHVLSLVLTSLPWAAAGGVALLDRAGRRLRCGQAGRRRVAFAALGVMLLAGVLAQQAKPAHPSRWGHLAAGHWLVDHAEPGEAVLDTRGWASFVAGGPSYDYWHVRQALTDSHLGFVVVGRDELEAPSRRAATLRALLAYAGEPAAHFSSRAGGTGADVLVYRFHPTASWEGLRP